MRSWTVERVGMPSKSLKLTFLIFKVGHHPCSSKLSFSACFGSSHSNEFRLLQRCNTINQTTNSSCWFHFFLCVPLPSLGLNNRSQLPWWHNGEVLTNEGTFPPVSTFCLRASQFSVLVPVVLGTHKPAGDTAVLISAGTSSETGFATRDHTWA